MKNSKFADFCTSLGILVLSAVMFYAGSQLPKPKLGLGPGDYPMFISAALFCLGLILGIQSLIGGLPKPEKTEDRKPFIRMIMMISMAFVYITIMDYLGFIIMTPLFLFAAIRLYGYAKWKVALIISLAFTVAVFFLFTGIFKIFLPTFALF